MGKGKLLGTWEFTIFLDLNTQARVPSHVDFTKITKKQAPCFLFPSPGRGALKLIKRSPSVIPQLLPCTCFVLVQDCAF